MQLSRLSLLLQGHLSSFGMACKAMAVGRGAYGTPATTITSYEQCYNAQAVVAGGTMLVMAAFVTQALNDKQQVAPMLEALAQDPECLPPGEAILLDTGYHSAAHVEVLIA